MANLLGPSQRPGSAAIVRERIIYNGTVCADIDKDLDILIMRCLAVDPENRPKMEALLLSLYHNTVNVRNEMWYATGPKQEVESDRHFRYSKSAS
ncbi:hypothetical protein F5B20DRAFT_559242 [Whalleya microplaca]|nr:hypothetical protein F5B20DRAFT_559242 [Whalleya microplaca]